MTNNKRSGGTGTGLKIYAVITSLLVAASAVAIGVGFGTGRWQVVPEDEPVQEQPDDQTPDEGGEQAMGGGAIIGGGEEHGISLMSAAIAPEQYAEYGVSPLAETAGSLSVTVEPSNATYPEVDWSLAWSNPGSSWASGKTVTDYLTITPSSDGARTATWQCLQAFGEPIVITVTSRNNPEVSATKNAQYVKRITNFDIAFNASEFKWDAEYTLTSTPTYSDGTLQGTVALSNANIQLTEGFKSAIEDNMLPLQVDSITYKSPAEFSFSDNKFQFTEETPALTFISVSGGAIATAARNQWNNYFIQEADTDEGAMATFTVDYTYTYEGETYSQGTATFDLTFNAENLVINVLELTFVGGDADLII